MIFIYTKIILKMDFLNMDANTKDLMEFSLKHLRSLCIQQGLSASGTKKVLVERIEGKMNFDDDENIKNIENIEYDENIESVLKESLKTKEEDEKQREKRENERMLEIIQQNMEYEESLRLDMMKQNETPEMVDKHDEEEPVVIELTQDELRKARLKYFT